jgi:hypothetical protein
MATAHPIKVKAGKRSEKSEGFPKHPWVVMGMVGKNAVA